MIRRRRCLGNGDAVLTLVLPHCPPSQRAGTMATRTGASTRPQCLQPGAFGCQPHCHWSIITPTHAEATPSSDVMKTSCTLCGHLLLCRASNGSIPAASQGYYQGRFSNGPVSHSPVALRSLLALDDESANGSFAPADQPGACVGYAGVERLHQQQLRY